MEERNDKRDNGEREEKRAGLMGALTKVRRALLGRGWTGALLAPVHGPDCLLSRYLPGWAALAMRIFGWVSLPFYPIFCLLFLDYMNYRGLTALRSFWRNFPMPVRFEVTVMLVLFLALMLLVRRGAVAAGTMGAVSVIFGYINYMKITLNGDYFQPRDFTMAGQVGELTRFISGDLPIWFYVGVAAMVVWTAYLALCNTNLPVRWTLRFPMLLAIVLTVTSTLSTQEKANAYLAKYNMTFFDAALQSSNYAANGFVGAFTLNLLMNRIEPPEGYSRELVEELMEGFEAVPQTGEDYDVIVVLSESFFDVRTLPGVEFSENPLPNFDEIAARENAYSGLVFTTASSGGTVRPEFEILTGLSSDYLHDVASPYELVNEPVESFVSNYKAAGYRTVAIHPYIGSFYRRDKAYPNIGFDEFLDKDGVSQIVAAEYKREFVSDRTTFEAIKYELEHAGGPIFIEAITMQNHQPFSKLPDGEIEISVTAPALDETSLTSVTTYTQGAADADRMLRDLVDYIDGRERPTVLLFYGDHIPNLGRAYEQSGAMPGDGSAEERMYKYSTPFVIYTNTGAVSDMLPGNTGNRISSYYLLEVVARMTGFAETPFMSLLADFYSRVPVYNELLWPIEVTEDVEALRRTHGVLTYDRLMGERWSAER